MQITRKTIINGIVGRSQYFPNCNLKGFKDQIIIELYNCQNKEFIFNAIIPNFKDLKIKTYFQIAKYLEENPEIRIYGENKQNVY